MPRSLLGRLSVSFAALVVLVTTLVWAGVLSFEASYSTETGAAPSEKAAQPAAPDPPAAEVEAPAPRPSIRSTAGAIAAAEVAGRELVACIRAHGFGTCHTAAGIHDPRGVGPALTAERFDDYAPSWAARVVIVRADGGLAAVAFDADSMGVGYVVDRERIVNTVCVTPRGDCTKDPTVARFLKDEARLAEVTRRASKIG